MAGDRAPSVGTSEASAGRARWTLGALLFALVATGLGYGGARLALLEHPAPVPTPAPAPIRMGLYGDPRPDRGIIDEITIGASDIDATHDTGTSGNTGQLFGTLKSIRVISGSGPFVYVDNESGTTRTLSNLQPGDELAPISCATIKSTSHGSAALTLRVRW